MGGSAREWTVILADDLVPGSEVEIRLVLTKFGGPNVSLTYELALR